MDVFGHMTAPSKTSYEKHSISMAVKQKQIGCTTEDLQRVYTWSAKVKPMLEWNKNKEIIRDVRNFLQKRGVYKFDDSNATTE